MSVPTPPELLVVEGCTCAGFLDLHEFACALLELGEVDYQQRVDAAFARLRALRRGCLVGSGVSTSAAFADLPASAFPLVIEFRRVGVPGGEPPLRTIEVAGPGAVMIPSFPQLYGFKVWVRICYADGRVQDTHPPV